MAKTIHKIDLNPDTIIILNDATADFAVWDPSAATGSGGTETISKPKDPLIGDPLSGSHVEEQEDDNDDTLINDCSEKYGIEYQVSSRHLMLASPWFRRALTKEGWTESCRDSDGQFYIRTSGWDAEAFLILMNILHLQNRKVPRTVSLELLAKMVVLTDYYECPEATEVFMGIWKDELKANVPIPDVLCRDLLLWMCVAWLLRLPEPFQQTTLVAIKQESEESFDTLELPIPPYITGTIRKVTVAKLC